MKRKLSALILIVLSIFLSDDLFADPMFGKKELITDDWQFILNDSPELPDANQNWLKVDLPHDWSVRGQFSGRPYALKIVHQNNDISKDKGLAQVSLEVVDEEGIPVMISDDEITCHIVGPARLLGLEASNNSDMGDYTDHVQRVFHGRLLAYIQASGAEGIIKVKFTSPWLKEIQTEIATK